ncbi:hypothetical protein PT974_10551 [Cladobotryum mycophilum]|uniref:Uncharacterized protein n=1 Tax=Cladobotryum mycophilum TaxID=491253 RepID=A0ABR0SAB0_9HYPO
MRFFTNAALLVSLLGTTALAVEEIGAFGINEASIASSDVNTDYTGDRFELNHGKGVLKAAAAASCPSSYPLYCSRYDFCCPSNAVGCCANACCGKGTTYCGSDGHCYGRA